MLRSLLLLFIVIIVFICQVRAAEKPSNLQYTGCLYNGYIYYTPNGTSGGLPNYAGSPEGASILATAAFCVENVGGDCRIDKRFTQTGKLNTFYMAMCPIDDYIPLICLTVGVFGFFKVRKLTIENV